MASPNETTPHPAHIRREVAGSSRRRPVVPASQVAKVLLMLEIPARSRSARNHQDRPVTPEVAGSSPVAPVKYLQISIVCCLARRKRPPASIHPAHIPHGNPRTRPAKAANSRNPLVPATRPEVVAEDG